jgi:hypothetical protein
MRLVTAAFFCGILPAAAAANCDTAKLALCTMHALGDAPGVTAPCAIAQCATADAVFDYMAFAGDAFVRVDMLDGGQGRMNANLGTMGSTDGTESVIESFPVRVMAPFTYRDGDDPLFEIAPCDDRCAGVDADGLME